MEVFTPFSDWDPGEGPPWEFPVWGHPISQWVLPIFITHDGRYHPIGTAFWVGRGIGFVLTATHNVHEALRRDGRFSRELSSGKFQEKADLKHAGLCVLHQQGMVGDRFQIKLLPLENVSAAPPTDVAIGYPSFEPGVRKGTMPLGFDPPRIGELVLSIGYTDFQPSDGISIEEVKAGRFDWLGAYSHRLIMTQGTVTRIFTKRFAAGFVEGPCFSFDAEIAHGQSGGPIISEKGAIIGVNAAGATGFFDSDAALGSMIYPLLLTNLNARATLFGSVTINSSAPLYDLIGRRQIDTDGSETNVAFTQSEDGPGIAIGPRTPIEDRPFIHDDFGGLQSGLPATKIAGPFHRLVRRDRSDTEEAE